MVQRRPLPLSQLVSLTFCPTVPLRGCSCYRPLYPLQLKINTVRFYLCISLVYPGHGPEDPPYHRHWTSLVYITIIHLFFLPTFAILHGLLDRSSEACLPAFCPSSLLQHCTVNLESGFTYPTNILANPVQYGLSIKARSLPNCHNMLTHLR